jgi:hypothetical protein
VVTEYQQVTEKVRDGDTVKTVTKLEPVTANQQITASLSASVPGATVKTISGQPLDDRHLAALKQREIPVVISVDGMPVDPVWLQNIKPQMLLVTPPASRMGHGPPPPAPVAPAAPPVPGDHTSIPAPAVPKTLAPTSPASTGV